MTWLESLAGTSLGDIIAKVLDRVDGKKDGYLWA